MAFPFLDVVVGSMIWMYVFESHLVLRQLLALKLPTLPKSLEGLISQENFEKSRAYYIVRSNFRFVHQLVNILTESTILWIKVLPWFWKKSGHFVALIGLNEENEILHTLPFLAGVLVWLEIRDLSFSLYYMFVIEAHHGFNKQTIWLFLSGKIIGFCLTVIHAAAIVPAAIFIVKLPKGQIREEIETLASSLNFPLKKLLVVNHSRWSSHSNAYMGGFFDCKRIVLYDTVIQQFKNDEEIVALVAHELGHWKDNHVGIQNSLPSQRIVLFLPDLKERRIP